jgi:hypothetical protein
MKKVIGFAAVVSFSLCASLAFASDAPASGEGEKSLISIIIDTIMGNEEPAVTEPDPCYCGTLPG